MLITRQTWMVSYAFDRGLIFKDPMKKRDRRRPA